MYVKSPRPDSLQLAKLVDSQHPWVLAQKKKPTLEPKRTSAEAY